MASTQAVVDLPEDSNNGKDYSKKEKQNKRRRKKQPCELLMDFSQNTTLHGMKYIAERGLSAVERMFWIVTSVTSLCLCLYLIWKVWVKWEKSPVIVTLSERLASVAEVPFPAVTICPQAKIRQEVYNYTKHKIDISIFERQVLMKLPQTAEDDALKNFLEANPTMNELHGIDLVCKGDYSFYKLPTDFINYTAVQSIQKIAPQLRDILIYGQWRTTVFNSGHHAMHPVLTQEGVCFTFNSLHEEEIFHMDRIQSKYKYKEAHYRQNGWSLQDGFSSLIHKTYPYRGRAKGAEPDLILYLKEIMDRDIICDGVNRGFKVYLHHPADLPQSSLYYYAVLPDQVASFAIKVNVMETTDSLANYPPNIRQCYFPGERDLWYFKLYTHNNCLLECLTNYTIELCGCALFHMPHNDEIKICSVHKNQCILDGFETFSREHGIENSSSSFCNCMPLCNNVQYEAEVLKTNFNVKDYNDTTNNVRETIKYHSKVDDGKIKYDYTKSNAAIEMYFKEPYFVSMRRSELFGLTDFLANCGGLLGLFLGFSFLSLVEIFYFLTLRLAYTSRRDKIAEKNAKENEKNNEAEKY